MGNDKIIQIEVPLRGSFPTVNCFLVEGPELTLVDAGKKSDSNWKLFGEKVRESGHSIKDIQKIVLTHQHIDHVGFLPQLLKETEAMIYAPLIIQPYLEAFADESIRRGQFEEQVIRQMGFTKEVTDTIIAYMDWERMELKDLAVPNDRVQYFENGDTIAFGNKEWKALHCPGHCSTQFCLGELNNQMIWGGDMLLPITPMAVIEENPEKEGIRLQALPQLLASFERLKTFNFQEVYPGHGKPFGQVNKTIDSQIKRVQRRKEECYQAIASGASTVFEIGLKLYPPKNGTTNYIAIFMTLGYIDLLLMEDRIQETIEENRLLFSPKML